jgi:hypothetical protein
VGHPEEGAFTVVESDEVRTSWVKTMLMFGYACMFTKEIEKFEGSLETEFQATV